MYQTYLNRQKRYFKEADDSFQHFSNSYTLKDEYCHCLTSDATILVSYKFLIIGKQAAVILFMYQVSMATIRPALKKRLILVLSAYYSQTSSVTSIFYYRIVISMESTGNRFEPP